MPSWFTKLSLFGFDTCSPLATFFIILFALLNLRGTKNSERFNAIVTGGKLLTVVLIILAAFTKFSFSNMTPFTKPEYGFHGIVQGSTILYFAMTGYDFISTISEEAKNTKIEAPLAMIDTVVICVGIYMLVAIAMCGMGFG